MISFALRDQSGKEGAQAIQSLGGFVCSQSNKLNLEITRRAAVRLAIHQTEQAETLESLEIELGRAGAGALSRVLKNVPA